MSRSVAFRLFVALTLGTIAPPSAARAAPASIEWEVAAPFRLIPTFTADSDFVKEYRAQLAALSELDARTPVLSVERQLRKGAHKDWAKKLLEQDWGSDFQKHASCWHWQKKDFVSPGLKSDCAEFIKPTKHAIVARIQPPVPPDGSLCRWLLDGQPFDRDAARSCADEVRGIASNSDGPHRLAVLLVAEGGATTELAAADVRVEDLLIAGLGDSFASGEGNPDWPVKLSAERTYHGVYPIRDGQDKNNMAFGSRWSDPACHRSVYSQHFRAALHLALAVRHRSVGFIGLACSGAEIGEGLIGEYQGAEPDFRYHESVTDEHRNRPQLKNLLVTLCGNDPSRIVDEGNDENRRFRCRDELTRRVDLLLLSIGGNDIGFSGLVAYTLLQDAPIATAGRIIAALSKKAVFTPKEGLRKIGETKAWFASLEEAFLEAGILKDGQPSRVVLTGYPMPIQRSAPSAGEAPNPRQDESLCAEGVAGMEFFDPTLTLRFDRKRSAQVREVVGKLYTMMSEAAAPWQYVTDHQPQFLPHGYCSVRAGETLALPVLSHGAWSPEGSIPSGYDPYAPRDRWFRTPNDAYMVVNHRGGKDFLGVEDRPDLSTVAQHGSLLSGSMHPTAEGHAAIADHVVCVASDVLADKRIQSGEKKARAGCGKVE